MTTKRDKKDEPKAAQPKRKRETVKDLTPEGKAEGVRGGKTPTPGGPIPVPYPN